MSFPCFLSAGFLRSLRRFISSGAWAEDVLPSSGSSDSSVLSASTVESLVHRRIRGGEVEAHFRLEESEPAAESDAQTGQSRGSEDTAGLKKGTEISGTRGHPNGFGRYSKTMRVQCGMPHEVDSDDALPPQIPGRPRENALLSHKLDQLSKRKVGTMRRVLQESAGQSRLADA